jgi:dephospho-CoA kinase
MAKCKILLLGGIGSGKSAVARILAAQGFERIDADKIGHAVLFEPDLVGQIAERWPSTVVDGAVDRRALGAIVFSDPSQLAMLESMTHPRIRRELARRVSETACDALVIEMPILRDLVAGEWNRVVVDADDEVRLHRLRSRGLSTEEALARMAAQPRQAEYIDRADQVIRNDGSLDELREEVTRLLWKLCGDSAVGRTGDGRELRREGIE